MRDATEYQQRSIDQLYILIHAPRERRDLVRRCRRSRRLILIHAPRERRDAVDLGLKEEAEYFNPRAS